MNHTNARSSRNRQSIVKLFIIFITITVMLFIGMTLGLLIPKIEQAFESIQGESDRTAANVYARQLQQFIHDRELALGDIATNSVITNSLLLNDENNPAFRDYIDHTLLLGEDPDLTIINIIGDVLYSEANKQGIESSQYQWALSLLDNNSSEQNHPVLIEIESTDTPQISIAIPILYGKRRQGIIIAQINANPNDLFIEGDKLGQQSAVAYTKNGQRISSSTDGIRIPHFEEVSITDYGLTLTYISDRSPVLEQQKALTQNFVFTTALGAFAILLLLYLFGRRIIVKPFQELADSQQSIASAVEGISYIDTSGCYVKLNQAYAGTAGYTPEELEGKPWTKTVYPEDLPALEDAYNTMIKDGKVTAEARGQKKDGSIFYKRVTMISRYDDKNIFIGHDCFMQDISTQKMAEEKIRKHQNDLQLIFDNVPVRILYKDDKNHIIRLNKKAAESMGGTPEDFEGKDCYDLFPEMAKKYHDDDLKVIESQTAELNIVEEYTPLNAPRGWVSTDKIPYTDPTTQESFIFVSIQDITALKNAESAQNNLIKQLSHTNKELEEFAYIASHDLKAPLRGIEQLSGWIQQDCAAILPEKSKTHLSLMSNRVQRMSRMLEDLLTYSHVARIDLTQEPVDLKAVLHDLLDLHVQPFGFTHSLNIPDEAILISRKPFEIIIRNLLDNAVKHHHKSDGHISISYAIMNNAHIIEVSDDGPGIDPALHDKAFKMFQTLQARDKIEGSGMGLALIRKILARYGGSISINTDSPVGTTFKIVWPFN